VVKSLSPRRSASFTMSFKLASRARRNRLSAAATSSSSVSVGPHASRHNRFDAVMSRIDIDAIARAMQKRDSSGSSEI
jgi:hypothetical protein